MTFSNFWDRFPKADSTQSQDNTSDYWGQFPQIAETPQETGLEEPSTPADSAQPQELDSNPSLLDKAKRLGGIAAHGFAQGVGGLADLATIATKGMEGGFSLEDDQNGPNYNLKDYETKQVSDVLGNKVNEFFGTNLEPKDAFEKFIHLIGEFSVPMGIGGKAASLGGKLLNMGKHEALAAGGAAGITAAEEAGVKSTLGKMAAGIGGTAAVSALGSVNPKALALTLAGFGKNQLKTKALDAAKRIGVDLPGVAATDAVAPAAAHNLISRIPYFGDKIRDTLAKTGEQYQRSFEALLNKVSPPLTEDLSQSAKRIYAPLESIVPTTDTIDPTPWLKEIRKLETKLQSVAKSEPTKKLLGVFREIKQNLEGKTESTLPEYLTTASETVKKSLEKQLQELFAKVGDALI